MGNYETVDDIRTDALRRAGEPQSSTSDFWTDSLTYINKVQQILILGGGVAVGRDLATSAGIYSQLVSQPLTDWWWARKFGAFTMTTGITTGTVSLTQGSTAVTFSSAPSSSVKGWRIEVNKLRTVPRFASHAPGSTSAVLDAEWPEDDVTGGTYRCWQEEYDLADDFVRFAGAPVLHSNYLPPLPVTHREQLVTHSPLQLLNEGEPKQAAMIAPRKLIFDTFDTTRGYRFEYEYICMPTDLVAGGVILLPHHHRQVLAVGTSMLILHDKNDSKAETMASEYRELVARMAQEHRHLLGAGSPNFGQFKLRAEYGRRNRSKQPYGEQFLT